ncbi:OpgC family protein [Methylocapsa sp. S129]|uniref:OpgC family protein n=1 Tax=Methylocapsa sp. S129 TaxID=1641869 RepID=UPI00131D9A60|nr:OpgC domain-containing protein [Methylocapsa sp. S129]
MTQQGRLDGIDFWRGCVLCTIFVDHMPGNVFENATPRNFGFSDAAEAFVFLSGVSIALAYGRHFSVGERLKTLRGLGRRALKLYGAHIGLSLVALAIFFSGAAWAGKPDLLEVHGRDLFVDNPGLGLIGLASLGHQLGYFNILPLYMILILCVPALLSLAAVDWRLMLVSSGLVYGLARFYQWNLPNWPDSGAWFFDPFAWQFLFAIGIAVGLNLRAGPVPRSRPLAAVAALIVLASALVVTHGFWTSPDVWPQGFWESVRGKLDLDKSQLGFVRLVHFLALAYLIYALRLASWLRGLPLYGPLTLLGRNSLWVFVLVSLFSAIWQVLVEMVDRTIGIDIAFAGVGLAIIYAAARVIDGTGGGAPGATSTPCQSATPQTGLFEAPLRGLPN